MNERPYPRPRADAGLKCAALVAGMVTGLIPLITRLASFFRSVTSELMRQLSAVAFRFLDNLGRTAPLSWDPSKGGKLVVVEVGDTFLAIHGSPKQLSGYGFFRNPRPERWRSGPQRQRLASPDTRTRHPTRTKPFVSNYASEVTMADTPLCVVGGHGHPAVFEWTQ